MLYDIKKKRSLPHGRPGRNDEHVPRLEAVALAVQLVKPSGKPLNLPLAGNELFKVGDGLLDDGSQTLAVRVILGPLPDLKDMSLHGIQEGRHVLRIVEGLRHGLGGSVNNGPQEGLIAQGAEIMLKIGPGGGERVNVRQACAPPHGVQLAHVRKSLRYGNNIQGQIGVVPGEEQPPQ